jgi:hypothetical protein
MKKLSTFGAMTLFYLISITHPLQGVGNAIVYFRPRYLKFRDRDSEELRLSSALRSLDLPVPSFLRGEWQTLCSKRNADDDSSQGFEDYQPAREDKATQATTVIRASPIPQDKRQAG